MNKRKLLEKMENSQKNVRYGDFVALIEAFVFKRTRGEGSHEIYRRAGVTDIVNIQSNKGKAKAYQVRQFLSLIEIYNLRLEEE